MSGSESLFAWFLVAAIAPAVAVATVRLRWLTPGGGASAVAVGLVVLLGTGIGGLALLLLFFLTSSALTTFNRRTRRQEDRRASSEDTASEGPTSDDPNAVEERLGRGREAVQVLANGGVAALAAASGLVGLLPGSVYVLVGSLAAATADTWATELGTRVGARTRLVTTWQRVLPGRSGGVSWPGSVVAVAGAGLIGVAAALLFSPIGDWSWLAMAVVGGVSGTIADSFAGAGIEGRVRWIDNNVVNGICTVTGGVVGWMVGRALLG